MPPGGASASTLAWRGQSEPPSVSGVGVGVVVVSPCFVVSHGSGVAVMTGSGEGVAVTMIRVGSAVGVRVQPPVMGVSVLVICVGSGVTVTITLVGSVAGVPVGGSNVLTGCGVCVVTGALPADWSGVGISITTASLSGVEVSCAAGGVVAGVFCATFVGAVCGVVEVLAVTGGTTDVEGWEGSSEAGGVGVPTQTAHGACGVGVPSRMPANSAGKPYS